MQEEYSNKTPDDDQTHESLKFNIDKRPFSELIQGKKKLQVNSEEGFYEEDEDDLGATNNSRRVIMNLNEIEEKSSDTPEAESQEDRFSTLNEDLKKTSKSFRHKTRKVIDTKDIETPLMSRLAEEGTEQEDQGSDFNPEFIHSLYQEDMKMLQDRTDSTVTIREVKSIQDVFQKITTQDEYVIFKSENAPSEVQISKEDLLESVKEL